MSKPTVKEIRERSSILLILAKMNSSKTYEGFADNAGELLRQLSDDCNYLIDRLEARDKQDVVTPKYLDSWIDRANKAEARSEELEAGLTETLTNLYIETKKAESAQAKIDALMLEYCPDEMTEEQIKRWGECQVPASEEKSYNLCEDHKRWPCPDCGTKHFEGCECGFCRGKDND